MRPNALPFPPRSPWSGPRRAILTASLGVLAWTGCGGKEAGPAGGSARGRPADARYIGSAACGRCHARELEAWSRSHHARAMMPAADSSVLGDFRRARFTRAGVSTQFSRREGRFWARTDGPDGTQREYPIAYTFGITPLQQYLLPTGGGRLQALGIAWDSRPREKGGQRWFHLYPGARIAAGDPLHWTGREQNWNYQCAECHSTNLRKNYDLPRDRYATTWSEIDVGCEACHGPGSAHAAWARDRKPDEPARTEAPRRRAAADAAGLLVPLRPAADAWRFLDLDRGIARWTGDPRGDAELDACARCHSRRRPIVDPYEPGRPLLDTHAPALLDDSLYHADGQILGEVYEYASFLQSRMHRAGVVCSDCHEPHGLGMRAAGDALCARCHFPAKFATREHHRHPIESPGARCVACHMPARTYMVVDPRLDHSIRVPRPDLTLAIGTPNACGDCHRDRTPRWVAERFREWYGDGPARRPHFAAALQAGRRGALDAERLLAAAIADSSQPAIARATALNLLPAFLTPESVPLIGAGTLDRSPLVRASACEAAEALPVERRAVVVAPLLTDPIRAVRLAAAHALADVPAGLLEAKATAGLDSALRELIASELVSAERPESHLNLSNLYVRRRRMADAEAALRTALRLDPRFVPALVNLADLARGQGRDSIGEGYLEEALRLEPGNATVVHALGLLRVRQRRAAEAVPLLRRAAELAPANTRYAYVYAISLHATGDAAGALRVLERAHRRRPADVEVLSALVGISRERGDVATALRHAETLSRLRPQDETARNLVQSLRAASARPR